MYKCVQVFRVVACACQVDTVTGFTRIQTIYVIQLDSDFTWIILTAAYPRILLYYFSDQVSFVAISGWLFPKFQKLFSFTWSSFHVYGSLLSNQIEASNVHKKWIVWHLRVWKVTFACKTNIDVSSLRFVLWWDVARNATSLMMSHKPR